MIAVLELRDRFYAETNRDLKLLESWEYYSKWLEQLAIKKNNQETVLENKVLRDAFYEVADQLRRNHLRNYLVY